MATDLAEPRTDLDRGLGVDLGRRRDMLGVVAAGVVVVAVPVFARVIDLTTAPGGAGPGVWMLGYVTMCLVLASPVWCAEHWRTHVSASSLTQTWRGQVVNQVWFDDVTAVRVRFGARAGWWPALRHFVAVEALDAGGQTTTLRVPAVTVASLAPLLLAVAAHVGDRPEVRLDDEARALLAAAQDSCR